MSIETLRDVMTRKPQSVHAGRHHRCRGSADEPGQLRGRADRRSSESTD